MENDMQIGSAMSTWFWKYMGFFISHKFKSICQFQQFNVKLIYCGKMFQVHFLKYGLTNVCLRSEWEFQIFIVVCTNVGLYPVEPLSLRSNACNES